MSLPVRWTTVAEESFAEIIEFLEERWSEREVRSFIRKSNRLIKQISLFPYSYESSALNPNIRRGFVVKQCSLFYEVKADVIVLLYFWDNRRDPASADSN
jgi:plasmid stabilization system protein ParE